MIDTAECIYVTGGTLDAAIEKLNEILYDLGKTTMGPMKRHSRTRATVANAEFIAVDGSQNDWLVTDITPENVYCGRKEGLHPDVAKLVRAGNDAVKRKVAEWLEE